MQPALIRVIDNIRKQLDASDWQGTYEETLVWPKGTTAEQQQTYASLQKGLHGVPPEEHDRVAAEMSKLPQPSPLYTLRLRKEGQDEQTVDIWDTCYRVCSANGGAANEGDVVQADTTLFDEAGEIDWLALDEKTKALIARAFQALAR